jgi:hypothetical protein
LLLVVSGLWFWQTQANQPNLIPAAPPPEAILDALPQAGANAPAFGPAPPTPPEAPKASREEMRFNRYDRNRDELISRIEMMGSRTKAFKALDRDGNNLLIAVALGQLMHDGGWLAACFEIQHFLHDVVFVGASQ